MIKENNVNKYFIFAKQTPSLPNQSFVREYPHYSAIENTIEDVVCDFQTYTDAKCNAGALSPAFLLTFFIVFTRSVDILIQK